MARLYPASTSFKTNQCYAVACAVKFTASVTLFSTVNIPATLGGSKPKSVICCLHSHPLDLSERYYLW
jgi:hypothetical protein